MCYNSKIIRGKPRIFDNSVESLEAKECRRVIPAYSTERVRGRLDLTGLQLIGKAVFVKPMVYRVPGFDRVTARYSVVQVFPYGCTGCLDLTGLQLNGVASTLQADGVQGAWI